MGDERHNYNSQQLVDEQAHPESGGASLLALSVCTCVASIALGIAEW